MSFNAKTIIVIVALIAVAYFAYTKFYGGMETEDIGKLIEMHRSAATMKQRVIVKRVIKLYTRQEHYDLLAAALDDDSSHTQALAVEVLAAKHERPALPKLFAMLKDPRRHPTVTEQVVNAFGVMRTEKGSAFIKVVDRLIELTDDAQPHNVRVAAHDLLKDLLKTGVVKFGDGMRSRWEDVWTDRKATRMGR